MRVCGLLAYATYIIGVFIATIDDELEDNCESSNVDELCGSTDSMLSDSVRVQIRLNYSYNGAENHDAQRH